MQNLEPPRDPLPYKITVERDGQNDSLDKDIAEAKRRKR